MFGKLQSSASLEAALHGILGGFSDEAQSSFGPEERGEFIHELLQVKLQ
jgi:hypothetical protein